MVMKRSTAERLVFVLFIVFLTSATAMQSAAQNTQKRPGPPQTIAENQLISYDGPADGIRLAATFYPGYADKETIPIILLHDWKGSRKDFEPLLKKLMPLGYAIMIPDLRGHGESTTRLVRDPRSGRIRELSFTTDDFNASQFSKMISKDMSAIRRFLVAQNNEGKLNLNRLILIGAGTGGNVAMEWSIVDWSNTNYSQAGMKNSRDTKAVVMLSPYLQAPGFNTSQSMINPILTSKLPIEVLVGQGDETRLEACDKLVKAFRRNKSPNEDDPMSERVWMIKVNTKKQGTDLLAYDPSKLDVPDVINQFITEKVLKNSDDSEWMEHK